MLLFKIVALSNGWMPEHALCFDDLQEHHLDLNIVLPRSIIVKTEVYLQNKPLSYRLKGGN